MSTPGNFEGLCQAATQGDPRFADGFVPYDYQRRIAEDGLPELLEVPTGCGKTLGVVLGWLWRRRFHPDAEARDSTPRRLVYVLPQRVLVEQVTEEVRSVLDALELDADVACSMLMGGEGRISGAWRLRPEGDAILIATQDMALSAALNRRYGESRWIWPIEFGLFNNDCAYVFDEIQLMGPALPTSRQLDGLRRILGTAIGCTSTWMSATVDETELATVDRPTIDSRITLSEADRSGHLAARLSASRTITQVDVGDKKPAYAKNVATAVLDAHRAGSRTIAVCNTVARASQVYEAITRAARKSGLAEVEVVLVHSRFRPADRRAHLDRALDEPDPNGPGTIVVTTQVLEAGVDISSAVMYTESAPWSSVVQRAGRCNRDGAVPDARLLWGTPPNGAPYDDEAVAATTAALIELEGRALSTEQMVDVAPESPGATDDHQVLRRRDLIELFDTLPDLSGSDIDISRFVRDADDRDLSVVWLDVISDRPPDDLPLPRAELRCPAPIADAKHISERRSWRYDHLAVRSGSSADGAWVPVRNPRDLRPGMVVIVDAADGGYDVELGWTPKSRTPVPAVPEEATELDQPTALRSDTGVGDDPLSMQRRSWVRLVDHLSDVEAEATAIDNAIGPNGLSPEQRRAAIVAARLHDLGKAHPVFQHTLEASASDDTELSEASEQGPPWAKSGGSCRSHHARRFFRHELASALALLDGASVALDGETETDLIVYLVAAHHGRVRLGFRSLPDESDPPEGFEGRAVALGIVDGEELPAVEVPGTTLPRSLLDLSVAQLGRRADGQPSWAQRMLPLRDRDDLGPFRLGYLEATVRMADWRASVAPGRGGASSQREELP